MPIYEFRCSACKALFELLILSSDEQVTMRCPKCQSEEFERVLSTASYAMGGGKSGVTSTTRNCSEGSCTTYTLPGPSN